MRRLSLGLRVAVLASAVVALLACGQTSGTLRGIVTSVEGDFADITTFTVLADGAEVELVPVEDGDYAFPLSHLREHQRTGEPVFVDWELIGTVRYALSLADG
jgi:hypothetical protein